MGHLLTIVHVSDLHIGNLGSSDDAELDSPLPNWFQFLRTFEGYFGHGRDGLTQLVRLFERLLRREKKVYLAVTGDLTAAATDDQYRLARNFLYDRIKLHSGEDVGLAVPETMDWSIPGNHDHWKGTDPKLLRPLVMLRGTSAQLNQTFPELPIPIRRIALDQDRNLIIAGIDTDADVRHRYERFWARGSFCSQLEILAKQLKDTDPSNEVRVLLLHHSRSYSKFTLGICPESRRKLIDFISEFRITVLLSGHVHVPARDVQRAKSKNTEWDVLEARCGTTTQRDTLPEAWPKWQLPPNTLIVHRLFDVADDSRKTIEWRTSLFQRTVRGFVECSKIPTASSFFDAIWNRPVTVWQSKSS